MVLAAPAMAARTKDIAVPTQLGPDYCSGAYTEEFNEFPDIDVYREVTEKGVTSWNGPVTWFTGVEPMSNGNFKFKYVALAARPTGTASCPTIKAKLVIRD